MIVFVDADAFIGVSIETDPHHNEAKQLFAQLADSKDVLVTSWDTVDETASKLSQFSTKQIALSFLNFLGQSAIMVYYTDYAIATKALKLFAKQTSKRVSLTDCTNMIIAKSLGAEIFFSFDRHYEKNGFKLLK